MRCMGTDEAGKGDYFGYIVVAGVIVEEDGVLRGVGVKDSKKILDKDIFRLERVIKKYFPFNVVKISPLRYNELYVKFKSMNKLLAWLHARVIENLLEKNQCDVVFIDKFCKPELVRNALMFKGRRIKMIQQVHGEKEICVAAASVLARAEFLRQHRMLGKKIGVKLPKGAKDVADVGITVIKRFGVEGLKKVAKYHFKTTKQIINGIFYDKKSH